MLCNLDSSEYARSFEQNPTLPWSKVTPVAGLNLLPVKVSDSPNFFSGFSYPNSVLLCSFLGLWSGFINPSQQFLGNQYFPQTLALFEKETSMEKPLRFTCSKIPRIRKKNPLKWVVSISRDYWIYFDIIWKSSKDSEFWEKVPRIGTFSSSKFSPATGVRQWKRMLKTKYIHIYIFKINKSK